MLCPLASVCLPLCLSCVHDCASSEEVWSFFFPLSESVPVLMGYISKPLNRNDAGEELGSLIGGLEGTSVRLGIERQETEGVKRFEVIVTRGLVTGSSSPLESIPLPTDSTTPAGSDKPSAPHKVLLPSHDSIFPRLFTRNNCL